MINSVHNHNTEVIYLKSIESYTVYNLNKSSNINVRVRCCFRSVFIYIAEGTFLSDNRNYV